MNCNKKILTSNEDKENRRYFIFFIILVIVKLALVSNYEIGSGGFDAGEYARLAFSNYWGEPALSIWDLRRGPGLPLLITFFRYLGIPYFLGLELLSLLSFYLLGIFSLKHLPFIIVALSVSFAVFSPATYTEQILMSDQPFAVMWTLMLVTMAFSLRTAVEGKAQPLYVSIAIGVFAFFLVVMRNENVLIYFLVLIHSMIIIYLYKNNPGIIAVKAIILTLFVLISLILSVKALNYIHYGYFKVSIRMETNALFKELHYISLANTPDVIGISEEALLIAAEASPSFKEMLVSNMISYRKKWVTKDDWRGVEINNILRALNAEKLDSREGLLLLDKCVKEIRENTKNVHDPGLYVFPFGRNILNISTWYTNFPVSFVRVLKMSYAGFKYRFFETKKRSKMYNFILNRRVALLDDFILNQKGALPDDNLSRKLTNFRKLIQEKYSKVTMFIVITSCVISLVYSLRGQISLSTSCYLPFIFISFSLLCRITAYAILDCFFFSQQARHIVNVNPMIVFTTIMVFAILTHMLCRIKRSNAL